jgi:hypothetical protein
MLDGRVEIEKQDYRKKELRGGAGSGLAIVQGHSQGDVLKLFK